MSTYVFSLNDISVEDGSPLVSVNNSDSFFGLIEGSQLFIAGKLPATIIDHDTTANTLTLKYNWQQGDLSNVAAQVVPIGAVGVLLQALENNRAAYAAFLENAGSGEVEWESINNPPQTSLRWPNFSELAGKISKEQLPDDIDTDNKKTQAMSPPVRQNQSLTHILSDYPTLKKTEELPSDSPNNERQIRFDDVRGLVHLSLTDKWLTIPTTIATRKFAIFWRGLIIRLNSAYTGSIKMRVYPMGVGGNGLPNNPTLANHQWHEYETTVTNLYKIGEFNSEYFEGIIDYVELDSSWASLDSDHSYYRDLNGYFDVAFGTLRSPFKTFYLRSDNHWYGEDITPQTPNYMGASWQQDPNDFRRYTVTDADGGTDALRLFGDNSDEYSFEIILIVHSLNRDMAITISNSAPNIAYAAEPYRFITEAERIYFKRKNGAITGTMTIEAVRIRIPAHEY
ncbi:hypothetical protein [Alteromonas sp. AO-Serp]|uniref:hypothetical protein n=1 Tax=Alteromonas sp. AO-Serp TaxID=2804349 RepID=UPI00257EFFB0|nr:hypothetical protein [Alteromonas sp. AO-Serp]